MKMAPAPILAIPTVTEDDLHLFHTKHFGDSQLPSKFFMSEEDYEEYYEEEDDGLGYYADGVKRTLTEEQINMFRHSEIQTLLRERRIKQENATSDEEGEANVDTSTSASNASLKKSCEVGSAAEESPKKIGITNQVENPKRKWNDYIEDSESNPDALTHRRIARELDELKSTYTDLMYGDEEPSPARPARKSTKPTSTAKRQVVSYDD